MGPDDLTATERRLYAAVADGRPVDLREAEDRTVRAAALTLLLHDPPPPVGVPGLRLRGARVTGRLRLRGTVIDLPLVFTECEFDEPPQLMESLTRTLRFTRCRMPGLGLARLRLDGVLSLKESVVAGRVDLDHAQIDGELHLSGAVLECDPAGDALHAEGLQVTGVACFDRGFTATGSVRLPHARFGSMLRLSDAVIGVAGQWGALYLDNAHVAGSITLRAASVNNPGGVAIAAGGLQANGALWLNHGFEAVGEVRFIGAALRAPLTLSDAVLKDGSLNLEASVLTGLHAPGIVVEGGQIRLVNARLTGDLELSGARLEAARDGVALAADGMTATAARLSRLHADGLLSLVDARVTGDLDLGEARLDTDGRALDASGLVAGKVQARDLQARGLLVFDNAQLTRELELVGASLGADDGLSLSADGLTAGELAADGLTAAGRVSLLGGQISGDVLLSEARIGADGQGRAVAAAGLQAVHFVADEAVFAGRVSLRGAQVAGDFRLIGTRITGDHDGMALLCNGLAAGQVLLNRTHARGRIALRNAQITADLSAEDAVFVSDGEGRAFSGEGLSAVNARMARLRAEGKVSLRGSQFSGVVELADAHLTAAGADPALLASWMTAGGLLLSGLAADGRIVLRGTQVTGQTYLDGARLAGDGEHSIVADGLHTRTLRLHGARLTGEFNLRGARITDQLFALESEFTNPGGVALRLSLAEVVGDVFLERTVFTGALRAAEARIGRTLQLRETVHEQPDGRALQAKGLQAGRLVLHPARLTGTVQLSHARLGILEDDTARWPEAIELDGLTYEALEPRLDPQARLDWLARDPRGFQPQPYEQLAAHYTALGQQHHAQTVLLARERRQGRTASGAGRVWSGLQDLTVGYGYQPARAAAWLALLVAIGSVVFALSPPRPIKADEHPAFNPVMYTVDLLLPIVDLGQERAFNPVDLYQWFSYLLVAAGWILATTIAAGAARTIGRR
ncbi:hypothetical protein [Actinocorallia libanotica]|uniref:Membrane-associated oxidoreductase n=1 Tax=Actinocorallia libanotica TaxID=46162 RepID=A0ABN1RT05_9ACTN